MSSQFVQVMFSAWAASVGIAPEAVAATKWTKPAIVDPRVFPYVYRWHRQGRKGQLCRLLARGTMNSCLLEFEDGYRMVTSRNAIMRAKA